MIKRERLPIVMMALLCLIFGLWGGLNRIGWSVAVLPIMAHHGAVMVGGFLGTLISLEKIIPLKRRGLYIIPVLNALSVVFFFCGQTKPGIYTLVISSAGLCLVFLYYFRLHRDIVHVLMFLGAACWLTGNLMLLTKMFYPLAFPWWAGFGLLIIAAERLELMKFLQVSSNQKKVFIGILLVFMAGALFSFHGVGNLLCGMSIIGSSVWLMRNDLIAINIKRRGLPGYTAVSLLAGYMALLLSGIFFCVLSEQWLNYDVIVHSFFIGFVFSMIFAHGPMILPGVMGISVTPFSRVLYFWLLLLQVSWLTRVAADVMVALEVRKISGLLSAVAILGYFLTMGVLTRRTISAAHARRAPLLP